MVEIKDGDEDWEDEDANTIENQGEDKAINYNDYSNEVPLSDGKRHLKS